MNVMLLDANSPGAPALTGQPGMLAGVFGYIGAEMGWFSDSNSYRVSCHLTAPESTGLWIDIRDDGNFAGAGSGAAAIRLYEDMTAVGVGTDPTTEVVWTKSFTSNATPRYWRWLGDALGGYFWVEYDTGFWTCRYVGDFQKLDSLHGYNCIVTGGTATNYAQNGPSRDIGNIGFTSSEITTTIPNYVVARSSGNSAKSVNSRPLSFPASLAGVGGFDEPENSKPLLLLPVLLNEVVDGARPIGYLPGLLHSPHELPPERWEGSERVIDGKKWKAFRCYFNYLAYFQVSGDWRA